MGDRTLHRTEESDKDEEELDGKVLGGGGDEFSVMPVFYPRGKVSVLSLTSFSSVGASYKPSHPYLPLSLGVHLIQDYFKKNRGGGGR